MGGCLYVFCQSKVNPRIVSIALPPNLLFNEIVTNMNNLLDLAMKEMFVFLAGLIPCCMYVYMPTTDGSRLYSIEKNFEIKLMDLFVSVGFFILLFSVRKVYIRAYFVLR
jgi:hypothetical protein